MREFVAVLVCAIIATALAASSANQEQEYYNLIRSSQNAEVACNTDAAIFADLDKPGHQIQANFSARILCFTKKVGWQNADGSVNATMIRSNAPILFGDGPKLEQIITECIQPQETPEATAQHLMRCARKYSIPPRWSTSRRH